MTVQIHDLEEIFQWAEKEYYKGEKDVKEFLDNIKTRIVQQTAQKLEDAGMKKTLINSEITKRLSHIIDKSTVRKALGPEYKNQEHRDSILKRYSSSSSPKKGVEVFNPSTKSSEPEERDAYLEYTQPRKEPNWKNGEMEKEVVEEEGDKKQPRFSPEEWQVDMFKIEVLKSNPNIYKHWMLAKVLIHGFDERGWRV